MGRWKPIPGVIGPDRLKPGGRNKRIEAYPDHDLREWIERQTREAKKQDPTWSMSKQVVHLLRIARREVEKPLDERVARTRDERTDRAAEIMRDHHVGREVANRLAAAERRK